MPSARPVLDLGFFETKTRGTYAHPDVPFTLEFVPGPVAIGDEIVSNWNTVEREGMRLHVISAFDCVRDRMAAAIHWRDPDSARQAAAVAKAHAIDLASLEEWCRAEGGTTTFALLKTYLERPSGDGLTER